MGMYILWKNSINSRMQRNYIIFWLARTFLFSFHIYKSRGGTSHFTLHTSHFTLHTSHFGLHASHNSDFTLHTLQTSRFTHFRLQTSDFILHFILQKFKTSITYEQEFWQELRTHQMFDHCVTQTRF